MSHRRSNGRLREKRAERTRRRILDAGLRVFSKAGYDGASMDSIALEMEATKGLLYYYFRSKRELLSAILREHPLRTGIDALQRDVTAESLQEALSIATSASLKTMRKNRAFIRFLLFRAQSSREQAQIVFHEVLDKLTAAFESIIEQHLPPESPAPAPVMARQIVDLMLAAFIRAELGGRRADDVESYVQDAVETVMSRVEVTKTASHR